AAPSQSGDGAAMLFEDIGCAAAAADARDYTLVPIMNGSTFARRGEDAGRLVIGQGESRPVETTQSLIEASQVRSDGRQRGRWRLLGCGERQSQQPNNRWDYCSSPDSGRGLRTVFHKSVQSSREKTQTTQKDPSSFVFFGR